MLRKQSIVSRQTQSFAKAFLTLLYALVCLELYPRREREWGFIVRACVLACLLADCHAQGNQHDRADGSGNTALLLAFTCNRLLLLSLACFSLVLLARANRSKLFAFAVAVAFFCFQSIPV